MRPESQAVAVRAWTTIVTESGRNDAPQSTWVAFGPSRWSLTFDTETTVDLAQTVRLVTYQVRWDNRLRAIGVAYDPAHLSPDEGAVVQGWAHRHDAQVMTIEQFNHDVLLHYMWRRRALVVGFNLPFDLSRLAIDHDAARPRRRNQTMRGGFTFAYSTDPRDPRIQIKKIGPRAAFIRCATPKGRQAAARNRARGGNIANHRGYFADGATLAVALLSEKKSLAGLADLLHTEHRKIAWHDHNTVITAEYLDYAMNDTQVHWECFAALRDRYEQLQLPTPIYRIYSEASIGKAHLDAMGIQAWRNVR
jgi:hypothetical protein